MRTSLAPGERVVDLRHRKLNGRDQIGDGRGLFALGLWPFWGTAVALGVKRNETRGWPAYHFGPLAIYQTKALPAEVAGDYKALQERTGEERPFGILPPGDLPRGVVVAVARVAASVLAPEAGSSNREIVRFWNGDGTLEEREVPPPDGSAERLLGDYATLDRHERRFAHCLTDLMPLAEPLVVPPSGSRQRVFALPAEVAEPLLVEYRAFLIARRPRCSFCAEPLGSASWRVNENGRWWHKCGAKSGTTNGASVFLPDPALSWGFRPGWFPEIAVEERPNEAPAATPTLF